MRSFSLIDSLIKAIPVLGYIRFESVIETEVPRSYVIAHHIKYLLNRFLTARFFLLRLAESGGLEFTEI